MKIAVASTGKNLEDQVSNVFGRCPFFVIVEVENDEIKNSSAIENSGAGQRGGAGISAAQLIGNQGAEIAIAGNTGPNASNVLNKLNIDFHRGSGTVREAVKNVIKGGSEQVSTPITSVGTGGRGPGGGGGQGTGTAQGTGVGRGRGGAGRGGGRGRGGRGRGKGAGGGRAGGPDKCICPNPDCDYEETHQRGTPCSSKTCPKCDTRLIGKWS